MDRGAWWAAIHGVAKSRTQLSDFTYLTSLTSYFITGEGNGNPLQCPFLENLMDRGESHGQRSLVGCNPWGHKESGTTERLTLPYLLRNPGPWAESDRLKAPEAVLHQF